MLGLEKRFFIVSGGSGGLRLCTTVEAAGSLLPLQEKFGWPHHDETSGFDDDSLAVQVRIHHLGLVVEKFIDGLLNSRTAQHPVVVEEHNPARSHSLVTVFYRIEGGL